MLLLVVAEGGGGRREGRRRAGVSVVVLSHPPVSLCFPGWARPAVACVVGGFNRRSANLALLSLELHAACEASMDLSALSPYRAVWKPCVHQVGRPGNDNLICNDRGRPHPWAYCVHIPRYMHEGDLDGVACRNRECSWLETIIIL